MEIFKRKITNAQHWSAKSRAKGIKLGIWNSNEHLYFCSATRINVRPSAGHFRYLQALRETKMDNKISTYSTLWCLVDLDDKDHSLKTYATLFLEAMNDWKLTRTENIYEFITDLKNYFGNPLTIKNISEIKIDGTNTWELEAGCSIAELIRISTNLDKQDNFDKIIANFIDYYNKEFSKVDFIAQLQYLTTEQGGRRTPVFAIGYRPQIKFDFDDMQTSGQQTFIDKEIVYPGEKVKAKIKILASDYFSNRLTEGMNFEFREGSRVIGTGEIEYIVNDKLEKPAGNIGLQLAGSMEVN